MYELDILFLSIVRIVSFESEFLRTSAESNFVSIHVSEADSPFCFVNLPLLW